MIFPNRKVAQLTGHSGPVHCVTFSAGLGQYILTGSADRTIRLFNPTKAISASLQDSSAQSSLQHSTSLRNSSSSSSAPSHSSHGLIQSYSAHGYEVLDISVTEDNSRFASVGGDRQVFLWDVATAKTLRRWAGHGGRVNCVGLGGDGGVVVSGSFDATVRLWDCKSQSTKPIQVFEEAKDSIQSLHAVAHEIVTGCVDGSTRLYDLRMGMVYVDFIGQPITSVHQSLLSPTILVSTLDSHIRLLDKGNGQLLQSYTGHTHRSLRIRSCFGLAESVVVSGSEDGKLYAWDVLEGKILVELEAHAGKVASAVAWNGKGSGTSQEWASAGVDGVVTVWGMQ